MLTLWLHTHPLYTYFQLILSRSPINALTAADLSSPSPNDSATACNWFSCKSHIPSCHTAVSFTSKSRVEISSSHVAHHTSPEWTVLRRPYLWTILCKGITRKPLQRHTPHVTRQTTHVMHSQLDMSNTPKMCDLWRGSHGHSSKFGGRTRGQPRVYDRNWKKDEEVIDGGVLVVWR